MRYISILLLLLGCASAFADTVYTDADLIPLSFTRYRNGIVTGLTVTVVVKNATTGATLLASTSAPETVAGNGIYTYNWSHGLTALATECISIFTVGSATYQEYFIVRNSSPGGATR